MQYYAICTLLPADFAVRNLPAPVEAHLFFHGTSSKPKRKPLQKGLQRGISEYLNIQIYKVSSAAGFRPFAAKSEAETPFPLCGDAFTDPKIIFKERLPKKMNRGTGKPRQNQGNALDFVWVFCYESFSERTFSQPGFLTHCPIGMFPFQTFSALSLPWAKQLSDHFIRFRQPRNPLPESR